LINTLSSTDKKFDETQLDVDASLYSFLPPVFSAPPRYFQAFVEKSSGIEPFYAIYYPAALSHAFAFLLVALNDIQTDLQFQDLAMQAAKQEMSTDQVLETLAAGGLPAKKNFLQVIGALVEKLTVSHMGVCGIVTQTHLNNMAWDTGNTRLNHFFGYVSYAEYYSFSSASFMQDLVLTKCETGTCEQSYALAVAILQAKDAISPTEIVGGPLLLPIKAGDVFHSMETVAKYSIELFNYEVSQARCDSDTAALSLTTSLGVMTNVMITCMQPTGRVAIMTQCVLCVCEALAAGAVSGVIANQLGSLLGDAVIYVQVRSQDFVSYTVESTTGIVPFDPSLMDRNRLVLEDWFIIDPDAPPLPDGQLEPVIKRFSWEKQWHVFISYISMVNKPLEYLGITDHVPTFADVVMDNASPVDVKKALETSARVAEQIKNTGKSVILGSLYVAETLQAILHWIYNALALVIGNPVRFLWASVIVLSAYLYVRVFGLPDLSSWVRKRKSEEALS
jgi:hypothetical protein